MCFRYENYYFFYNMLMKKRIFLFFVGFLMLFVSNTGEIQSQNTSSDGGQVWRIITGKIYDNEGLPLIGATITAEGGNAYAAGTTSSSDGSYLIRLTKPTKALNFSFIGMEPLRIELKESSVINVTMYPAENMLEEFELVSLGYTKLSKERVTGSATLITAKDIAQVPTISLTERLQDLSPGMYIDPNTLNIQIRGINSFGTYSSNDPLIVVDGFPMSENDDNKFSLSKRVGLTTNGSILSSINPNDIASITILKDAAALSIWGAKAANGVIVIETKRGQQSKPTISFSTSLSVSSPMNMNKLDQMSSAQYIELEQELFDKGMIYDTFKKDEWTDFNTKKPLSEANEWMFKVKRGMATEGERDAALARLASINNHKQIRKYLMQNAVSQQYNLSVSGGGKESSYFVSGNYSKDVPIYRNNKGESMFFSANVVTDLFENRVKLTTGVNYTFNKSLNNNAAVNAISGVDFALRPYELLKDENGNNIKRAIRFRPEVLDDFMSQGYLDWYYNSIDELDATSYQSQSHQLRLNIDIDTKLNSWANIQLKGQIQRDIDEVENIDYVSSYYMRDRINYSSTFNEKGQLESGVPMGGSLQLSRTNGWQYVIRPQLNINKYFGGNLEHNLSFLAGAEFRQNEYQGSNGSYWGFDEATYAIAPPDPNASYPIVEGWDEILGGGVSTSKDINRALSYFSNAALSVFDGKYVLSGSVRFDDFTMIGVSRKQRAKPLWSVGAKWNLMRESFMQDVDWANSLDLRMTYGVNGTVPRGVGYKAVITTSRDMETGEVTGMIDSPANSQVTWEKVRTFNFGVDYSILNSRLALTADVYTKRAFDILYEFPYNYTYGWDRLLFNSATMKGHGVDLGVRADWFKGKFNWRTSFNFGYNTDEITDSRFERSENVIELLSSSRPMVGHPYGYLYAYRWAGLDSNGQSQIYDKNGNIITADKSVMELKAEDLRYMGRTSPPYFGGLINNFSYKDFTLGVRITYAMGHVFRRSSVDNYPKFSGEFYGKIGTQKDLTKRWRQPGDEEFTDVPGIVGNSFQNNSISRYANSDKLVVSGSHIRLQQISFGYNMPSRLLRGSYVQSLNLSGSVRNIGIIWKKNKDGIDPDYRKRNNYSNLPPSPSFYLSVNATF